MTSDISANDAASDIELSPSDTDRITETPSRSSSLSVGAKIYGVVGLCLALLAAVGGAAIWQMGKIGTELEAIAERDIPLTSGLTQVTIHQLEQAVNFERAFRFGEEMTKHPEIRKDFEKTVHHFEELSHKVEKELKQVEIQAQKAGQDAHTAAEKKEFSHVVDVLKKVEVEHKSYETMALKALKLVDLNRPGFAGG